MAPPKPNGGEAITRLFFALLHGIAQLSRGFVDSKLLNVLKSGLFNVLGPHFRFRLNPRICIVSSRLRQRAQQNDDSYAAADRQLNLGRSGHSEPECERDAAVARNC